MEITAIIKYCKQRIEPLPASEPVYGPRYRVAATLSDGLILPCVVIESTERHVDLAIRRFEETKTGKSRLFQSPSQGREYREIVKNFVATSSRLWHHDITSLAPSPYAIPIERLQEVKGETSMGWTGFTARMQDGTECDFGTTYYTEFFQMPEGYSGADITKIIPAERGQRSTTQVYRERPFFTCYVEGLEN